MLHEVTTTNRPHTTFANGVNPFSAKPVKQPAKPESKTMSAKQTPAKPAAAKSQKQAAGTLGISITSDPLPPNMRPTFYKYDHIFDKLQPGQSLRVASDQVNAVANSMRDWSKRRGLTAARHVRSVPKYCQDAGYGRVWLMDGPSPVPPRKSTQAKATPEVPA